MIASGTKTAGKVAVFESQTRPYTGSVSSGVKVFSVRGFASLR